MRTLYIDGFRVFGRALTTTPVTGPSIPLCLPYSLIFANPPSQSFRLFFPYQTCLAYLPLPRCPRTAVPCLAWPSRLGSVRELRQPRYSFPSLQYRNPMGLEKTIARFPNTFRPGCCCIPGLTDLEGSPLRGF